MHFVICISPIATDLDSSSTLVQAIRHGYYKTKRFTLLFSFFHIPLHFNVMTKRWMLFLSIVSDKTQNAIFDTRVLHVNLELILDCRVSFNNESYYSMFAFDCYCDVCLHRY
jgi:hypothetical protein